MAVTPEVQTILDMVAAAGTGPIDELTPEEVRQGYEAMSQLAAREDVGSVTDLTVPTPDGNVPVRVYVPVAGTPGEVGGRRPVLVYFHGGGWTIGSIESHDHTCRSLANGSGATVVSVEYRLAPEHPYPAAVEDSLAAVHYVVDHADELGVDPDRLALGGDSAGGNLTAVLAQRLRSGGPRVRFQLMVYPVTDLTMSHPSIDDNAEGYFLTKATMLWFRRHYLGDRDPTDPLVSPLHAPPDALAGLPPALIITAEYDPLRDEGEAYGAVLEAAGADVTVTRYDQMIHGFFGMPDAIPEGKRAIDQACEALRAALA